MIFESHDVVGCIHKKKPQTNADRIRAMSDEELAAFLWNIELGFTNGGWCDYRCENGAGHSCTMCLADWLKQPIKDGEDDGESKPN